MSQKLSTITPTYHSFTPDQLLTHTDLNEVIRYFEDQDRLSRICLSGVGVVCGFKVSPSGENVIITQGTGVTTDGDLVHFLFPNEDGSGGFSKWDHHGGDGTVFAKHIDELLLTKYVPFIDSNANYKQFLEFGPGDITELLPSYASVTATDLDTTPIDFENKTILLYIDCYSKDPGACTMISCNSQGIEEVQTLRVLVINDDDLSKITDYDAIFNCHDVTEDYLALNNVAVPRVILDLFNTESLNALAEEYKDASTEFDIITNLNTSLTAMMTKFGVDSGKINSLTSAISTTLDPAQFDTRLFQYRYDLLKDLVDSYDELSALFIERYPECCPDIHAFPKHLMLGKLNAVDDADNPNRHSFYPSPIHTGGDSAHEHFLMIIDRMLEMTNNYDSVWDSNREIKITPSNLYVNLGDRSIPFYYDPMYVGNNSALVKVWDYKRRILRQYSKIKGYNQSAVSTIPFVATPLDYSIDRNNFYRIEGHQGKNYAESLATINTIKEEKGLAFDTQIVAVTVDDTQEINIDDYACEFQDLSSQLQICIDEKNCVLSTASYLFSAFTIDPTEVEGKNYREKEVMGRIPKPLPGSTVPSTGTTVASQDRLYTTVETQYQDAEKSYTPIATYETTSTETTPKYIQFQEILQNALENNIDLTVLDNPVVQKIYSNDNGLGSVLLSSFKLFSGINSTDTIDYIDDILDGLTGLGGDLENWDTAVKNATLYAPGRVMASSYAVSLLMPPSLQYVNSQSIFDFQVEITKLCQYAKQMQSLYEGEALKTAGKTSDDMYALVDMYTSQLEGLCCLGDKMQSILDEIEARKLKIITSLKLSNYIQDHTGLEHKAGVEPGGTFIMVYLADDSVGGTVPNGTVIADFALPYLCCSDCAPINFIVPKPRVTLSVPTSSLCIDPTSAALITLEFTVSPPNGVIEQLEPVTGVTIDGTTLTIIQNQFDLAYLSIPLRFTVDGQYTETFVVVNEIAVVSMLISPDPTTLTTTETMFTFTPVGANPTDIVTWDFGDGSPVSTSQIAQHIYTLPVGVANEAIVTLTVSPVNSACAATASETIAFGDITVSIAQEVFCENDTRYPFTVIPAGSTPVIEGEGVIVSGNQSYFNPGSIADITTGPFPMTYNGVVFASITVEPAPTVEILPSLSLTDELILVSNNTNVSSYTWEFYNADTGIQMFPPITDADPLPISFTSIGTGGTRLRVKLIGQATSPSCNSATTELLFTVPRDLTTEPENPTA